MTKLRDLSDEEFKRLYIKRQHQKQEEQPFIEQAVSNALAQPNPSNQNNWLYEDVTRPWARTGKNVARGAIGILDIPYIPINAAMLLAGRQPFIPPSEVFNMTVDKYGGDLTQPRNDMERTFDRASEFVGGLLGGSGVAKGAKMAVPSTKTAKFAEQFAPKTFKEIPGAAAAGGAFETVAQGLPESYYLLPIIASLLAGGLTMKGADKIAKTFRLPTMEQAGVDSKRLMPMTPETVSQSNKYGVRITPGEATGNSQDFYKEDATLAGQFGHPNEKRLREFKGEQRREFKEAATGLRNEIGGEPFIEKGAHAGEAIREIQETAKAEKEAIDEIFSEAREKGKVKSISPESYDNFATRTAKNIYDAGLTPDVAPAAYSRLRALNNLFKDEPNPLDLTPKVTSTEGSIIKEGSETTKTMSTAAPGKNISTDETRVRTKEPGMSITDIERNRQESPILKPASLNQLEKWRQATNEAWQEARDAGRHNEARAIKSVLMQYDSHMDDIVEKALIDNPDALLKFKEGRKAAAEYFQKYTTNDSEAYGKRFIEDIIENSKPGKEAYTPEMIVNKMFGTSELGFTKQTASIAKELKKHLSEKQFDAIRIEAAQKVLSPLASREGIAIDIYNNNLNKLLRENPTLMRELFSQDEIAMMKELGQFGRKLFTRPKLLTNPSGTAYTSASKALDSYVKRLPWLYNHLNAVELNQDKIRKIATQTGRKIEDIGAAERARILKSRTITLGASKLPLIQKYKREDEQDNVTAPAEMQRSDNKSPIEDGHTKQDLTQLSDEEFKRLYAERQKQKNAMPNQSALLNKIAYAESGNRNIVNPDSSASGPYQFIDETWNSMVKKYGAQTGIKASDKRNPEAQRIMAQLLVQENANGLRQFLGRQPTGKEIYLAHFLGLDGAKKLIHYFGTGQIAARLLPEAAKANRDVFFANGRPRTVEQVYSVVTRKI